MQTRLIATDLDGTFFGSDHLPTQRNVAALNGLHDRGIITVAITGRSRFNGIDRATSSGAQFDWFIGSNGGHVVEVSTGRLVSQRRFDPDTLERVQAALENTLADVGFGFELDDGFVYDDQFLAQMPLFVDGEPRQSTSAGGLRRDMIGKLFVMSELVTLEQLVAAVRSAIPDGWVANSSGVAFVEVTPPGADKGPALAELGASLGVSAAEVVAFGDNQNDLSMLRWAGRGVAMANAIPEAVEVADEVTLSNAESGVAIVLEQIAANLPN